MIMGEELEAGSVWWVKSWVLSGRDAKDDRPVVIVQAPRSGVAVVIVWARTSDTTARGVFTPSCVVDGLNKDGVIAPRHQHSIEVSRLKSPTGRYLGMLPEPYRSQVLAMWEAS